MRVSVKIGAFSPSAGIVDRATADGGPAFLSLLRHLYALYCLLQREIQSFSFSSTSSPTSDGTSTPTPAVPELFSDPGYSLLSTSILSTSNCGNPALRLFGFAEVTPEGYGIGSVAFAPLFPPLLVTGGLTSLSLTGTSSKTRPSQSAPRPSTSRRVGSSTRSRPCCLTSSGC